MAFPVVTARHLGAATAAAIAVATPFIIKWEGSDLVAQHFAIDPPGVITVCNGITNYDIPTLKEGDQYTEEQCAELLENALPKYALTIDRCVKAEISTNARAALYSAAYNLGAGRVCQSNIVRKMNEGDIDGGCDELMRYVYANKKYLRGLENRRRDERKLCQS